MCFRGGNSVRTLWTRQTTSGGSASGVIWNPLRQRFLLAGLALVLAGCAARRPVAPPADARPAPYIRAAHGPDGTAELEVALRAFKPARGRGPTVWLVGVTHLGTAEYYARLQRFLDAQGLVLFEGVGATNKSFALQREAGFNLQAALAKALGLEFQLHAIDYTPQHFQNSDLSVAELARIFSNAPPGTPDTPGTPSLPGTPGGEPRSGQGGGAEFDHLLAAMQGTGFLGALARVTVALLEASPRLQAAAQIVLLEVLSGLPNDLPQMPGLPPGFQNLLRVLIEERNEKVVEDVRHALDAKQPPRSIAIFYGAGHMTDLEARLRSTLGYRPAVERWMTALAVNPERSGLSARQLDLVRSWVRSRMGELQQP